MVYTLYLKVGKEFYMNKNDYKKRQALEQALKEYKDQTGIDYMKWLMGDEKERMRYKFLKWQERMNEIKNNTDEEESND